MEIKRVELKNCTLNLGELHHLKDYGFFNTVFHCRAEDGDEFVTRMRLHVTEPLDKLVIVDPRTFSDGGYAANSARSKILKRKSSYPDVDSGDSPVLNPPLLDGKSLYEIRAGDIKKALLNGYNFRLECDKSRQAQNKELKIAFTCHDPQIIGGGNIIMFRYINWLADLGVKVTVYSCGHHPSWMRVKAKFRNFSTYSEMFSAIEEDIVVLYSMWHIEPMLKTAPKDKRIYHLRQIYEPFHYGKNFKSMLARKPVIELLESLPLGVISVSPHLQQWYKEKLGRESLLITNGINVQAFYPSADKKLKSNTKRIVSVGSPWHFVKGAVVLADSLILLAKRRPDTNFEWTIACGKKEKIRPEETLAENLELIIKPGLNQNKMRELYQGADVVVNPSLYEGYGLPTLEAMACGVPVVQADNRGLDFIIEDNRNCLVVPINDSARMAEAIEWILTDEQLADGLRTEGIKTAGKYSTLNQFEMFTRAFEDILQISMPVEKVDKIRRKLDVIPTGENILGISQTYAQAPDRKESLVSVVIPSYNQAEYLREALDSLIDQTYPHWEAIVVNDGSTDNTVEVMNEYAQKDARIKPVNKENGGITNALNDGLKHCSGDYFCWLSSDDLYYPEKLEVLIKAFENLGDDYALVYGSFDLLQEEIHKIDVRPFAEHIMSGAEFPEPLKFDFIDGCSMMIRMDVMRELDGFNPNYRHSQDLELWMRIASRGYRFHLVDKKVTIRRVHIEQSSTTNMIHCRYDAARMVNYYLEHFHLLEMYRYFNFTLDDDIDWFVEHFVGRMLHTEACVNHPLIQEKFWKWFEHGLTALAPNIQTKILKKCLSRLMSNRSVTYKMKFYIKECLAALSRERDHVPFAPDFSIDGRDIRYHNYEDDEFVKALFDYGTNLLINENTPLFAQELYFHNTNKVVDTPFKLAHSVFRYLSQFSNPYLKNVEPYVDISKIPLTRNEAVKLFVSLRYPEYSDAFQKSLAFDAERENNLDSVEEHEKIISQMPQEYKEDLQQICRKNPTITILHYWNALALAEEGKFTEALTEGWKTLTLNHRSCDWRIAYKLGIWAEKANDFNEAARAYNMGYGCNPSFMPFVDGLNRVSRQTESLSQYKPTSKQFIFKKEYSDVPKITPSEVKVFPLFDGNYILDVSGISKNGNSFNDKGILSYSESLKNLRFTDPYTNKRVTVSADAMFNLWSAGYDFTSELVKSYKKILKSNDRISVAFTIRNSSILGGGSLILYRYINWLSSLGVDVAIYSDDVAPTWTDIKARFYHIKDEVERYASIAEPVVIVYSVLELSFLLRHCNTKGKCIYHLCQAVEDFQHYGPTFDSSIARKPIFEILHSLPVGRLAVSNHIQDYFYKQYGQQTHTIINGIDLNNYVPRWKRYANNRINVLTVGNPKRLLKGSADVKGAMLLLARKHPEWNLHLMISSGHKVTPDHHFDSSTLGFSHSFYWGLTEQEMCELYYNADVYVNSTWYEGFGLPTIEAMACGVPVVQVDNQGLDGIVDDGQNCLMVPPQNPERMAEALEKLIQDKKLRDCLINHGLETASRFSLKNQYEMFVKEFESILNCKFDSELIEATKQELEYGTLKSRLKKISSRVQPLISVLVPAYNQAKYLPEALDSLVAQTYGNWEAIVVNDGSTDDTPMVMEQYSAREPRIRSFHKKNGGISSALNEGLKNARGEWICWLSPDNLFDRNKLAVHIRTMEEKSHVKFFHSHYYLLDGKTGIKKKVLPNLHKKLPSKEFQVLNFFLENYIHGNSVVIHRSVLDKVGYFNEELRCCQDLDMWLRISALYRSYFIKSRTSISRLLPEQGTDILTELGISDSKKVYLGFLKNRQFPAFFPELDLSNDEQALLAVENALRIAINPDSFINRCGCASGLIVRLHDWLTNSASSEVKSLFKSHLVHTLKQVQNVNLTEETIKELHSMNVSLEKPSRHESHERVEKKPQHADVTDKISQSRTSIERERPAMTSQESSKLVVEKQKPLFSIIVPAYNQAQFLPEALNSVLSQTFSNWEAIVVNDGSTDKTVEVINSYMEKDSRIRIIDKTNGGVASALNEGIKNARGQWICWLSSDDMFEPDKLEIHLQAIKHNPDMRFFHTNYFIFDEAKNTKCVLESDPRDFVAPVEFQVLHFLDRNCANGISVVIHREVFDQVGYFNEEYKYGQDFDMWLRINLHYRAFYIDQKTVVTRWHDKRGTSSFPEAGFYDAARACIEFINAHKFNEFFPALDLATPKGAAKAIKETMVVVFNINAMMYKCYFNTALLERLAEWLTQCCPGDLKQSLIPYLQKTIEELRNTQLPEEITLALSKFSGDIVNNFCFIPHNFSEEATQYAKRLLETGDLQKARSIQRYLSLVESQPNVKDSLGETSESLVSVIMPAYNASKCIAKAIESVLSQDYRNFELIIVDDGSTDDTKEIIDSFKDDRIRYFYEENAGSASARNLAVKQSNGSFIVILDSDDMITEDFITKHIHEFEKNPQADLVYCDDCLVDENGKTIKVIEYPEYPDRKSLIRDLFRSGYPIVSFRTCIRKSVFDKLGLFDESLPVGEDYDMMRRFVKHDMKIHHLKGALYLRRMGFDSLSRNYTAQKVESLFEILRRFVDTFTYGELFPDVVWEKIPTERRPLHAKCLVAATYLSMAQFHVNAKSSPFYIKVAFEKAWSQLNECMKMDPNNYKIRELLNKCELGRKRHYQQVQHAVV